MTGWDSPDDLPSNLTRAAAQPGQTFLKALWTYLSLENRNDVSVLTARQHLLQTMYGIDWDLVGFALESQARGEDIFSAHPNQDVLLKYTPGESHNPDQQEMAF